MLFDTFNDGWNSAIAIGRRVFEQDEVVVFSVGRCGVVEVVAKFKGLYLFESAALEYGDDGHHPSHMSLKFSDLLLIYLIGLLQTCFNVVDLGRHFINGW